MTTEQQLRAERRSRFYAPGVRERNAPNGPAEALDHARRARDVDAAIEADRPGHTTPADARSRAAAALELRRRRLWLLELGG